MPIKYKIFTKKKKREINFVRMLPQIFLSNTFSTIATQLQYRVRLWSSELHILVHRFACVNMAFKSFKMCVCIVKFNYLDSY